MDAAPSRRKDSRIFLDHAATTPLLPVAAKAMAPWLNAGNPSSLHAEGRRAKDALDAARETVSEALGCLFAEVLFTSGGTEAANLAIVGAALANEDARRKRILLGAAEHHCVLHTEAILRRMGYEVELVPVDREGRMRADVLADLLSEDVLLLSVMHANNELGSINDIPSLAAVAQSQGALVHVDAVQTFLRPDASQDGAGWKVDDLGADLVTMSSHKVNGPKGAGAVYTRAGVKLKPLVGGGGQEREVRGGTENVAAIAGFGAAVRDHVARPRQPDADLRDLLFQRLEEMGAVRTVRDEPLLHGHVHVRFPHRDAGTLLIALDRMGIAASSGAACSSGSVEPSHVLLACGYDVSEAREGVRFTLGAETTREEILDAADRIAEVLRRSQP